MTGEEIMRAALEDAAYHVPPVDPSAVVYSAREVQILMGELADRVLDEVGDRISSLRVR